MPENRSATAVLIDERTAWRRPRRVGGLSFFVNGAFTLGPLVRLAVFGFVAGLVRLPDVVLHLVTGLPHVASSGVATVLGAAAALSSPVTAVVRVVDERASPALAPHATAFRQRWHSDRWQRLRQTAAPLRGWLPQARFLLASDGGRFVSGAAQLLLGLAVLSLVHPVSAGFAATVAVIGGTAKWGVPHLPKVGAALARTRVSGWTARLPGRSSLAAWVQRARERTERLPRVTRLRAMMQAPESLDDAWPLPPGDPRAHRHLSLGEARQLTTRIAGPQPGWSHPDRRPWFALAYTLKQAARGTPDQPALLPGEGAPEAIADVVADWTGAALRRGERSPAHFDMSPFGEMTARYAAAAVRHERNSLPAPVQAIDAQPSSEPPACRIPAGSAPEKADAEAYARRMLGLNRVTPEDADALRVATALILLARRTGDHLRLDTTVAGLLGRELCGWARRHQLEGVDLTGWDDCTAATVQDVLSADAQQRRDPAVESRILLMQAGRRLAHRETAAPSRSEGLPGTQRPRPGRATAPTRVR